LDSITVPDLLRIPDKLLPVLKDINSYRYFLIEGGRGGGKSQAIGRIILYLAEKKPLRIVCGREIQNSIAESVYSLLADLIVKYNLCFEVQANRITHRQSQTAINFRGFREQGAFNIQGMEGIDVVWIDESQAITKETLDVLIPTIRKDKAKIFFTMNRYLHNDPVYSTFVGRKDCLHIHLDYFDNPFCTEALKTEAEECKIRSEVDYGHIWLGEPLAAGDDLLFRYDSVYQAPKIQFFDEGSRRCILAVDVARFGEDETVFTIIQSNNIRQWTQIYQHSWRDKPLTEIVGKTLDLCREFPIDLVAIDDCGMGGGVTDRLSEQRRTPEAFIGNEKSSNPLYENKRAEGFFRLKEFFDKGDIKIMNDPMLMEQLLTVRYKFRSNGRKTIVSKDEMRKENIPSPDRADALMMAMYYTDRIFTEKIMAGSLQAHREAVE
jgi:phage terminase large subunit